MPLEGQDATIKSKSIIGNSMDNSGENGSANPDNSGLAPSNNNDGSLDDNHDEVSDNDSDPGYADNQSEYDNLDLDRDLSDNPRDAHEEMEEVSSVIEGSQTEVHYRERALRILEKSSKEWSEKDQQKLERVLSKDDDEELKSSSELISSTMNEINTQAEEFKKTEELVRRDLQGKNLS